jgi:NhaP-type Na+/H+ or K+/H+ antiporter
MDERHLLLGLAALIVLGVVANWIAWRVRLPAILLLLAFGGIAGPGAQAFLHHKLFDPDALLGHLLQPIVSLSVAVVLFEGGLTLNVRELVHVGKVVRNLVSIGMLVAWGLGALGAWGILRLPWQLAILLGAILVVTGPTVIGPLLRHVRPVGRVAAALKWEGIVIDPIGAILAVLVYDAVRLGQLSRASVWVVTLTVTKTALVGTGVGLIAAGVLVLLLRRYWIADYLQNPFTLMLVVAAFTSADLLQDDAGLLAVTVFGIAMANQRLVPFKHILEFKESLSVLLVSALFIVLASRLGMDQLHRLTWRAPIFVLALVLVIRPASVMLSTIGLGMNLRERLFLSAMAPRGIVAAAVSSVFALRLHEAGYPLPDQVARLVPITFVVIVATVVIYGLSARPIAQLLNLAHRGQAGFLIVGANPLAMAIATALHTAGQQVIIADTQPKYVAAARMAGFSAFLQSALSEQMMEQVEGTGIGNLLALTPNEEVNTLSSVHFSRAFGRSRVFQLATEAQAGPARAKVSRELRGRVLFAHGLTYEKLSELLSSGVIKTTRLTDTFGLEQFRQLY